MSYTEGRSDRRADRRECETKDRLDGWQSESAAWGALPWPGWRSSSPSAAASAARSRCDPFAFRVGPIAGSSPPRQSPPRRSKVSLTSSYRPKPSSFRTKRKHCATSSQQQGAIAPPQPVAPGSGPVPVAPQLKVMPPFAAPFKGGPWGERGGNFNAGGWHFPFGGFFGFPFGFLMGLPQALDHSRAALAGLAPVRGAPHPARARCRPSLGRDQAACTHPDQPSPASS